jgi:hypothetical protein
MKAYLISIGILLISGCGEDDSASYVPNDQTVAALQNGSDQKDCPFISDKQVNEDGTISGGIVDYQNREDCLAAHAKDGE